MLASVGVPPGPPRHQVTSLMHELAITRRLLEMVLQTAGEHGARRVTRVHLSIGELTSYVDDAIQFYFDLLSAGTIAEGARLVFSREPGQAHCHQCGHRFPVTPPLPLGCPSCGGHVVEITGGDACRVEAIEVE